MGSQRVRKREIFIQVELLNLAIACCSIFLSMFSYGFHSLPLNAKLPVIKFQSGSRNLARVDVQQQGQETLAFTDSPEHAKNTFDI